MKNNAAVPQAIFPVNHSQLQQTVSICVYSGARAAKVGAASAASFLPAFSLANLAGRALHYL